VSRKNERSGFTKNLLAERPREEIELITQQVREKIAEERKVGDLERLMVSYQRLADDYTDLSRKHARLLAKQEASMTSLALWKNTAITVIVALACTIVSITLYFCSLLSLQ
jgi:hypothetical protein